MNRIPDAILDAIESIQLPATPQVLLQFLEAAGDEQASADALVTLVMRDPALSARILTVANAAAFPRGAELRSIKDSLLMLGTRMVKSIATCLAVQSVFARLSGAVACDLSGFWRHSLFVAELSRSIAAEIDFADGEEAYLTGLLHDVGQLVLLGGLGVEYGQLLARSGGDAELAGLEQQVLNSDHAAVGAWLVDQWQLPSFMAGAIRFHHFPSERIASADLLTRLLWVAHGSSLPAEPGSVDGMEIAAMALGLGIDDLLLRRLCDQARDHVETLAAALGIAAAPTATSLPRCTSLPTAMALAASAAEILPAQQQMEDAVTAMAALQHLQHNLFDVESEFELLLAVRESMRILFGIGRLAFFLIDADRAVLSGAGLGGQPMQLQRLEIPLRTGQGLCVDAARTLSPCASFDAQRASPGSLIDEQIARALGSEGLLCVPMSTARGLVGVMVCGLSAAQHARLHKRGAWLRSFAQLTAASLEAWRQIRLRDGQIEATLAERYGRQGRKVAHEMGNPLGIIKNYLKIVDRKLPDASPLGEEIGILREEIDRIAQIVRQLSEAPGLAADSVSSLDVNALVEGMRALYGPSLFGAAGITLVLELQPQGVLARADRDSVKQILLNLWMNAADATPSGGRVVLSTDSDVNQGGSRFTQIRLSDSGPGLPVDVMRAHFEPLAADRRTGHSGLGLSIVDSLVKQLGGQITCQSRPGQGTTFTIFLPQADGGDR